MAKPNALSRIDAQIRELKRRAETVRISGKASSLYAIVVLMRRHGITLDEIRAAARSSSMRVKARVPDARHKVPPKYRHPQTGETWSGRGKPARWLVAAEAAGADRSQFLIERDDLSHR